MIEAAGILFVSPKNQILLLKRSGEGDHAKEWALAGGKIESGESPEQAALREFHEECGHEYSGELIPIYHTQDAQVEYTTFLAHVDEFTPKLNKEHTAFMWCDLDDIPNRTHPAVRAMLSQDAVIAAITSDEVKGDCIAVADSVRADAVEVTTEMDIAKKMRDGLLTSPQAYSNILMFSLRISGTGLAYRSKLNEYVERNPDNYLTEEFLERCNGLPVIWVHPDADRLDSDSFAQQVVGTICLPYIKGDEVWGIAKIYDAEAAKNMSAEQLSTSPAVIFQAGTNEKIQLANGEHVLIEGKPKLVDHLAIVPNGVWDKGGDPSGVLLETAADKADSSYADSADPRSSLIKEKTMADATAVPAEKTAEEQILAILTSLAPKIEAIEGRLSALEGTEVEEASEVAKPDSVEMMEPEAEKPKLEAAADKPAIVADDGSKARLDAVENELANMKQMQARSDNAKEKEELLEAQGRADEVEQVYGDSAPRPLNGDSVMDYEKRMVQKHLSRSPRWANSNIKQISDAATFQVIRDEVYADAVAAARSCVGSPDGTLRESIKSGVGGRKVHEFFGKPSAWTGEFKSTEMTARIVPASMH